MKTTVLNRFVKTTVLAAFMLGAFAMTAAAKPVDVSKFLIKQFQKQFSSASDVTWKTTNEFTSASFVAKGEKTSVFYNNDGNLIGVSKEITVEDLPKAAQKKVDENYSKFSVKSVIEFTDASGTLNYYIQLQNERKQFILRSDELGDISDFQN